MSDKSNVRLSEFVDSLNSLLKFKYKNRNVVFINYIIKAIENYFSQSDSECEIKIESKNSNILVSLYGVRSLAMRVYKKQLLDKFSIIKIETTDYLLSNKDLDSTALDFIEHAKNIKNKYSNTSKSSDELDDFFNLLGSKFSSLSRDDFVFIIKEYEKLEQNIKFMIKG